jgi:pimeloyl-ACP methyl ester carboxylesterase
MPNSTGAGRGFGPLLCFLAASLVVLAPAARAATPSPAKAVVEQSFVPIGGIDQWIAIRGDDRDNPVVLVLHGGPGDAWSPFAGAMFAGWEKDFTMVEWDQRGAGRTFGRSGPSVAPTMTVARMVQDGIAVSAYLARRLHKKKIILVGGSWGSVLGISMAHARPDLFHAYVGMAQMVNWRRNLAASYTRVLELARGAHDEAAIAALAAIGAPPWDNVRTWPKFRKVEQAYQARRATAPAAPQVLDPDYSSPQERAQYEAADEFSFEQFWGMTLSGPFTQVDLPALGTDFAIPIFIVQGDEDLTAVPELTKAYFDSITAPRKQFYPVPGAGHEPSLASLERTHEVLLEEVRPLALGR